MNNINKIILAVIGVVAFVVFFALVSSIIVMLLWNWLMPVLFGLKTITWLQAFGLSFLCGMLFKSSNTSK